jgi:hypothetical protein
MSSEGWSFSGFQQALLAALIFIFVCELFYHLITKRMAVRKLIVVVKKTFRYSNVFFYNHLCRTSEFRNIIMENGINEESFKMGNEGRITR